MANTVQYEKRGRIVYITLNRAEAMNTFNNELLEDLYVAGEEFNNDESAWVAVMSGAGRCFSAGADIKAGRVTATDKYVSSLAFGPQEIFKPIVAAIHGYALGEGCTTALACDVRIAADDAKIGYPHASHGFMTIGGNTRLPRLNPAWARYMVLVGEVLDAQEAHRVGLVHKVVPRAELMDRATETAERILRNAPLAVRYSKEVQERGLRMPFSEAVAFGRRMLQKLTLSEDLQEGVKAFLEKREPTWKGR